MEVEKKQQEAVAAERKGTTTRSRRSSGGESASKVKKVADGDQGKVKMVRCSQEFIDALLHLEKNPIRPINTDFLKKYKGSTDARGIIDRCNAERAELEAAHADILKQYRDSGVAFAEVVPAPDHL